jgi:DNA-binding MarR family transcriptional regulator
VDPDEPQRMHYRSAVVEKVTALISIWSSTRFQRDIFGERHKTMSALEVRLLWTLASQGPARASDLAYDLGIGAPSVSKAVAKLDEAGLVARRSDLPDQRSHTLHLTDEGRRVAQELYDVGDAMVADIFTEWDKGDVSQLNALLDRFVVDSERYARRVRDVD